MDQRLTQQVEQAERAVVGSGNHPAQHEDVPAAIPGRKQDQAVAAHELNARPQLAQHMRLVCGHDQGTAGAERQNGTRADAQGAFPG